MSRAAGAAFDALLRAWPEPECIQVLCGTGNNGGDGFLMADLAHKRGIPVNVLQLGDPAKIGGDALLARDQALANGVRIEPFETTPLLRVGVIVDAMLGTGLGGEVRGGYAEAIATLNGNSAPVLAVDIPSGLCSDTGRVLGLAVQELIQGVDRKDLRKSSLIDAELGRRMEERLERWGVQVERAGFTSVRPSPRTLRITQLGERLASRRHALGQLDAWGVDQGTGLALLGSYPHAARRAERAVRREAESLAASPL